MIAEVRAAKKRIEIRRAISDLDVDNPFNEEIAKRLTDDCTEDQVLAIRIVNQDAQILRSDQRERDYHENRHDGEDGGGDPSVRAGGLDRAAQPEALADDVAGAGENFT